MERDEKTSNALLLSLFLVVGQYLQYYDFYWILLTSTKPNMVISLSQSARTYEMSIKSNATTKIPLFATEES